MKIGENEVELLRRQFGKDCTTICRRRGVYKEVNLQWKILNWVGKLNCDSLLEYECLGNGGLGQLDQMVVIPKDWKFNL